MWWTAVFKLASSKTIQAIIFISGRGKFSNSFILLVLCRIASLLFFFQVGPGIRYPMNIDIPLNEVINPCDTCLWLRRWSWYWFSAALYLSEWTEYGWINDQNIELCCWALMGLYWVRIPDEAFGVTLDEKDMKKAWNYESSQIKVEF